MNPFIEKYKNSPSTTQSLYTSLISSDSNEIKKYIKQYKFEGRLTSIYNPIYQIKYLFLGDYKQESDVLFDYLFSGLNPKNNKLLTQHLSKLICQLRKEDPEMNGSDSILSLILSYSDVCFFFILRTFRRMRFPFWLICVFSLRMPLSIIITFTNRIL